MASLKIVAILAIACLTEINGSVIHPTALAAPVLPHAHVHAPVFAQAPPLLRYTNIAPPSVLPFSSQVSTFSRHLHVFDAPYAAGVLPGSPAIVQRAVVPGVPHAHLLPVPAPHVHAAFSAPHVHSAFPAPHVDPVLSRVAPLAPHLHALPSLHAHAYAGPHLHAAVARSVHPYASVAPGVLPATAFAESPLLG